MTSDVEGEAVVQKVPNGRLEIVSPTLEAKLLARAILSLVTYR